MSVGRSGDAQGEFTIDELEEYNEGVAVSTFTQRAMADADQGWASNDSYDVLTSTGDNVEVGDLLDLGRNEVAELTAVERTVAHVEHRARGSSGTTPGTAKIDCQFYVNDFPVTVEDEGPRQVDKDDDGNNEWRGVYLSASEGNVTNDDGALLFKDEMVIGQSFNDIANSTGGGGYTQSLGHFMRDYRNTFGRGPLMYPEDIISGAMFFDLNNWENEDIKAFQQLKCYWDRFEADDTRYDDVPLTKKR